MWDETEPRHKNKPYLWIVFLLLLLLLSSIFFLRPSIGVVPTGTMPQGKEPVVSNIGTVPSKGQPLYMSGGATGIWAVYQESERAHVSFLNAMGDEQWTESISVANALVASHGNYLAIAGTDNSQVTLYHGQHQLLQVTQVPGHIRSMSVNALGEILVCLVSPETEPLALRSQVMLYSALGQQLWQKSLDGFLPISCRQSANGNTNVIFGISLATKVQGSLMAIGRQGEPLFLTDITDRPVDAVVSTDGEYIAVASSKHIKSLARDGRVFWEYNPGGEVTGLAYVGHTANLMYTATRKSFFDFSVQSLLGSLNSSGKLAWQYRNRETVTFLGTAATSTNIVIGTGKQVHLYSVDGRAQWSVAHKWGSDYLMSTVDGKRFVVMTPEGRIIQVRGE